ncbi:MAG TPA: ATP-binding protein [Gemmatimonadales bacterium]|nr:ATP-binding protein [Gemmatimonadales bacterium]
MTIQPVTPAAPEVGYTYGVLAFLLVCLIAWLVRERSRAIRAERLLRTARRYAVGDLATRPGVRGADELGVLADAVEQMGGQLRTLGGTLRDRQEWFRMLLEHGSDVILTLDRDWRIGFAGPSLPRVLGWTPDQIARQPLDDYLHPEDADGVRAALELTVARSGFGEPIAFRFRHADGGWRSLEAIGNHPRNWSGPEHIIVSARDITLRERLEAQLRQAQKMEALGRFAGGVAHDFNNLLTAIQGYSSLLLLDMGPADPHREDLEEIRKASERAAALTRQILAFSRGQVGDPEPADLTAIVRDLERMLPRLIGEDVALVTVLEPGLRLVHADPRQLEQVIMNLVVNARDAMPDGGRLTIETYNELVAEDDPRVGQELPPGWYAVLTVSDTGTGIAPEIQASIFDPFFTTKEPGRGTGLGLSTVYGIVKQAGGHIEVESAPDHGSTFRIYLPQLAAQHAGRAVSRPAESNPRGEETVLLVEDEESVRVFASKALEKQGYTVLEARHGRDALLRLGEYGGAIHLLITDIVMPEMSGSELARRLIADRPDLRVLYMSGYADGETAVRGLAAGAAYLQKPFTSDTLARKVREVLGSTTAVR